MLLARRSAISSFRSCTKAETFLLWPMPAVECAIDDFAFPSRIDHAARISTRQYARLVDEWVIGIGLHAEDYGTHSLRRTKAAIIDKRTGNLRAAQIPLGHTKSESAVRYLGIDVDDALNWQRASELPDLVGKLPDCSAPDPVDSSSVCVAASSHSPQRQDCVWMSDNAPNTAYHLLCCMTQKPRAGLLRRSCHFCRADPNLDGRRRPCAPCVHEARFARSRLPVHSNADLRHCKAVSCATYG